MEEHQSSNDWIYSTVQEVARKTIEILNGKGITNAQRVEIDINVDPCHMKHITIQVTSYEHGKTQIVTETEIRWTI